MVRSTLKPGPYEGQSVVGDDGTRVGSVDGLEVAGMHVAAIRVRLDDGSSRRVPRDWFLETITDGILLARSAEDVRSLEPSPG